MSRFLSCESHLNVQTRRWVVQSFICREKPGKELRFIAWPLPKLPEQLNRIKALRWNCKTSLHVGNSPARHNFDVHVPFRRELFTDKSTRKCQTESGFTQRLRTCRERSPKNECFYWRKICGVIAWAEREKRCFNEENLGNLRRRSNRLTCESDRRREFSLEIIGVRSRNKFKCQFWQRCQS